MGFSMRLSLPITIYILWIGIMCDEVRGYSINVNSTFSVQEGLCLTIPCTFTVTSKSVLKNSRGSWLWSDSTKVAATNVQSKNGQKPNFHLTGNQDNGDCTLTITDARREDEGRYYFRFEDSRNKSLSYNFMKSAVDVKVTELSDKPEISPVGRIVVGEEVTLNCTSPGRCSGKSPLITWEGKAEKSGVTQRYMERNADGTVKYSASLTFTPRIDHDQSLLTCKVTFESNVTATRRVTLNVEGCWCMDSIIIGGVVAGNVVILVVVIVGSYCFLKRNMEKKQLGIKLQNNELIRPETESTYQDLIDQKEDIYYNLRIQQ